MSFVWSVFLQLLSVAVAVLLAATPPQAGVLLRSPGTDATAWLGHCRRWPTESIRFRRGTDPNPCPWTYTTVYLDVLVMANMYFWTKQGNFGKPFSRGECDDVSKHRTKPPSCCKFCHQTIPFTWTFCGLRVSSV